MRVGARGGLRTHLLPLDLGAGCLQGAPAVVVGNRSVRLTAAARAYTWLVKHTIYLCFCTLLLLIIQERLIIEQLYEIYIKLRPISLLEARIFAFICSLLPILLRMNFPISFIYNLAWGFGVLGF